MRARIQEAPAQNGLSPGQLRAACRIVYDLASGDHMLPPLVRDARDLTPPRRSLAAHVGALETVVSVELDERRFDPAGDGLRNIPLRFAVSASERSSGATLQIADDQRFELIRAFLLGARDLIAVEQPADDLPCKAAVRVSERFVVPVVDAIDPGAGASAGEICDRLADSLYWRSTDFFATREVGLAVWKTRLEQELLGEPPASPDRLWPDPDWPSDGADRSGVSSMDNEKRRRAWRRTIAIGFALLGGGGLAAALLPDPSARRALREIGAPAIETAQARPQTAAVAAASPSIGAPSIVLASLAYDRRMPALLSAAPIEQPSRPTPQAVQAVKALDIAPPRVADVETHKTTSPRSTAAARPASRAVRQAKRQKRFVNPLVGLGRSVARLSRAVRDLPLTRLSFRPSNARGAAGPY